MKLELFVEKIVVLIEEIILIVDDFEGEGVKIWWKVIIIMKRMYWFLGGIFIEIRIIVVCIMLVDGLNDGERIICKCCVG